MGDKCQGIQIQTSFKELSPNDVMFKIFGSGEFSFQKAWGQSVVDWSGFYTQLNPEHSMRYLTKKWDDGANEACLVLLKPTKNIRVLKIHTTEYFSDPKISGEQKAAIIKQNLKKKSISQKDYKDFALYKGDLLLKSLGQKQTLLQCIDMEDNEIIVPHQLLNENYFSYKTLITFKKSNDGLLRTIGWKWGRNVDQNDSDWTLVKGQCQYEPYLILKEEPKIIGFFKDIGNF